MMKITDDLEQALSEADALNERHPGAYETKTYKLLKRCKQALDEYEPVVEALEEIREIYTGMDGLKPETAPEGYQQWILNQIWDVTRTALSRLRDK